MRTIFLFFNVFNVFVRFYWFIFMPKPPLLNATEYPDFK